MSKRDKQIAAKTPPVTGMGRLVAGVDKANIKLKAISDTASQFQQPIQVESRFGWRDSLSLIAIVLSIATIAVTYFAFLATRESLTKEQISMDYSMSPAMSAQLSIEKNPDETPKVGGVKSVITATFTNTGRLPITIVGITSGDGDDLVLAESMSWIRMDDETNEVHSGPFLLGVGESIIANIVFPSSGFTWPPGLRQSDGRTITPKSIGTDLAGKNSQFPWVTEKLEVLNPPEEDSE